jgi:hypothetical protein
MTTISRMIGMLTPQIHFLVRWIRGTSTIPPSIHPRPDLPRHISTSPMDRHHSFSSTPAATVRLKPHFHRILRKSQC